MTAIPENVALRRVNREQGWKRGNDKLGYFASRAVSFVRILSREGRSGWGLLDRLA